MMKTEINECSIWVSIDEETARLMEELDAIERELGIHDEKLVKFAQRKGVVKVPNPVKAASIKFENGAFSFPLSFETWARLRQEMNHGEDYNKLLKRVISNNLRYCRSEAEAVGRILKELKEPQPWRLK